MFLERKKIFAFPLFTISLFFLSPILASHRTDPRSIYSFAAYNTAHVVRELVENNFNNDICDARSEVGAHGGGNRGPRAGF